MMQILVNGVIVGLATALLAVAFALVYVPTRIFHLALGGIIVAAPYVLESALARGWPPVAAVATAVFAASVLSVLCELLSHWPLEIRGATPTAHLIASLAVYTVLVQLVVLVWGPESRVLRVGIDHSWTLGGVALTRGQLLAGGTSALLLGLTVLWLSRTTQGLRLRALAANPTEYALRGLNPRRIRLAAFAAAGGLASAAAVVNAYDIGFGPTAGLTTLLVAIVGALIGGRGSFVGAAVGGFLIGVVRTETAWVLSARWQDAVAFTLLLVFLVFRPEGILGRRVERPEATA